MYKNDYIFMKFIIHLKKKKTYLYLITKSTFNIENLIIITICVVTVIKKIPQFIAFFKDRYGSVNRI